MKQDLWLDWPLRKNQRRVPIGSAAVKNADIGEVPWLV
jgi:hypothetical protein